MAVALAVAAVALGVVAGTGSAAKICLRSTLVCSPGPALEVSQGFRVIPKALPRRARVPIELKAVGSVSTTVSTRDGSHPSALRQAVFNFDPAITFEAEGLPVCGYRQIASRTSDDARRVCRGAIVGSGAAVFLLGYPENTPIHVETDVTLFNGGTRGRATRLFLHGFLPIRFSRGIVAPVSIEPVPGGRGGWQVTVEIPQASEGHGSLVDFALTVQRRFRGEDGAERSFLSARCPGGSLEVAVPELLFRNENQAPGAPAQTTIKGLTSIPCTPKR